MPWTDRFRGQHAVITGGSSGIGKAAARQLVELGASVSLIARDPARLEGTRAELDHERVSQSQSVRCFPADVAEREQVEPAVLAAIDQSGPPDLVVTAAGIATAGYFAEIATDTFERLMAVNYFGTLYAIRAALPSMKQRGRGHLALVSSGAGLIGIFGYSAYAPTKFAVRALAEVLRVELRPAGIGVSVIYPPDTDTPQLAAEEETRPEELRRIASGARTWSADGVARALLRGVERGQFSIAPGVEMGLLAQLHSLASPLLYRHFDRVVARTRRSGSG